MAATAILQHVYAVKALLGPMQRKNHSSYEQSSYAQRTHLENMLANSSLCVGDVGNVVKVVEEASFTADDEAALIEVLAAKADTPITDGGSKKGQNWLSMVFFLPLHIWNGMSTGDGPVLFFRFLCLAGLRSPDEHTYALMTTLILLATEGLDKCIGLSPTFKVVQVKALKKWFKGVANKFPKDSPCWDLPSTPHDLHLQDPDHYSALYAKDPPAACPWDMLTLQSMASTSRCRSSKLIAEGSGTFMGANRPALCSTPNWSDTQCSAHVVGQLGGQRDSVVTWGALEGFAAKLMASQASQQRQLMDTIAVMLRGHGPQQGHGRSSLADGGRSPINGIPALVGGLVLAGGAGDPRRRPHNSMMDRPAALGGEADALGEEAYDADALGGEAVYAGDSDGGEAAAAGDSDGGEAGGAPPARAVAADAAAAFPREPAATTRGKRSSVSEVTARLRKARETHTAEKAAENAAKKAAEKEAKLKVKPVKSKAKTLVKPGATLSAKTPPRATASTPTTPPRATASASATPPKLLPHVTHEQSRYQYMGRTGLGGPGSSKKFSYKKGNAKSMKAALVLSNTWCKGLLKARGVVIPDKYL
jgi:hypothetical protein